MKHILSITTLLAASAMAAPEDYVNFVRQIQADSGVEWDVSVAPQGTMLSPEGVGPEGSLFQLWSVHNTSAFEYHLDEEFVSAYTPTASITIQTGDPYEHVARTRVDQPFSVSIQIGGLISGNGVPPEAGQALLTHGAGNYPDGRHSWEDDVDVTDTAHYSQRYDVVGSGIISGNGTFHLNYGFTTLRGPDLTKLEGEELWTISAVTGGGGDPWEEGEVLESAILQVWPIADATISGLDVTEKYEDLPPITVSLNDLYPDSTTYLRVYEGAPDPNAPESTNIVTSYVIIQDSIPQDRVLTLDDIDDLFPKSGSYTLEVLHETPFGTDLLNQFYPLQIARTITVRGSIYSSE